MSGVIERRTARQNRSFDGRGLLGLAAHLAYLLLNASLKFSLFLLRLGAYDTTMYANAFMDHDIEAVAGFVGPDDAHFTLETLVAVLLRCADDIGVV